MQLSHKELSHIDEDELLNLPGEELRRLSIKLLNDLKEARERLSQNSRNSSRPPSKEAPWDKSSTDKADDSTKETTDKQTEPEDPAKVPPSKKDQPQPSDENQTARKPGKQPGAQGFGRTQKLAITDYQNHYPEMCRCCHQALDTRDAIAYGAYETIDIEWANINHPGIRITNTKHTLYEISCTKGEVTRAQVMPNCPILPEPNGV